MATRPLCTIEGCEDPSHYACQMRAKSLNVSPKAMSTRTLNMVPSPMEPPARNKEIIYSERPGGTRMPLLKPNGDPVRRKEYDDRRHQIDRVRRKLHNATTHTKD